MAKEINEILDELNHIGDGRILATKAELLQVLKEQKLQLLKEVEECVPKKRSISYYSEDLPLYVRQSATNGYNNCRTQIIKSIKELGEEL